MTPLGLGAALSNAFSVIAKNFATVLVIAVLVGGVGDTLAFVLGTKVGAGLIAKAQIESANSAQVEAVITSLCVTFFQVLWYGPIGTWGAAATIYLWVQREKGRSTSLYEAVNFGLNRLGRALTAHWKAYFFIQLGAIIIVGAILLGLKYAFVDAIAVLDDRETDPLARSGRLTQGRRGTLFQAFLIFSPWMVFYSIALTFILPEASLAVQFLCGSVSGLVLCAIDLVMVQFYLDLFRKRAPSPTATPATI